MSMNEVGTDIMSLIEQAASGRMIACLTTSKQHAVHMAAAAAAIVHNVPKLKAKLRKVMQCRVEFDQGMLLFCTDIGAARGMNFDHLVTCPDMTKALRAFDVLRSQLPKTGHINGYAVRSLHGQYPRGGRR